MTYVLAMKFSFMVNQSLFDSHGQLFQYTRPTYYQFTASVSEVLPASRRRNGFTVCNKLSSEIEFNAVRPIDTSPPNMSGQAKDDQLIRHPA